MASTETNIPRLVHGIGTLFDDTATITARDVINTILMDGESYRPTKIIRSGDCTIVFWCDGRKTIVRKSADVSDDSLYTAFTAALAIRMYGSNSRLKKIIKEAYVEQKPRKEKK